MYDVTTVNPKFDPQHSTNEIWRDDDDKIEGHVANSLGTNNQDVVLRAVYEF